MSASRIRYRSRRIASFGLLAAGLLLLFTTPASATSAATVAAATIAAPGATAVAVLPSGKAGTPFTVALPANAACPGDTAHSGYHVYSYLVPAGTNLAAVSFVNFPSKGYGLVDQYGKYYGAINTAENTGQIIGIPNDLEWGPLVTSDGGRIPIASLVGGANHGVWEAGIACANTHGVLAASWNTQVTFSGGVHAANGLTWKATPGVHSGTGSTSVHGGQSPSTASHPSTVAGSDTSPGADRATATRKHGPAVSSAHTHSPAPAKHPAAKTGGATEEPATSSAPGSSGVAGFPLAVTVVGTLVLAACIALGLRRKWRLGSVSTTQRSAS
jgi:hypothetical protein